MSTTSNYPTIKYVRNNKLGSDLDSKTWKNTTSGSRNWGIYYFSYRQYESTLMAHDESLCTIGNLVKISFQICKLGNTMR